MPPKPRSPLCTLTQFLIDERRRFPDASGDFNGLVLDVAMACKGIARSLARGRIEREPWSDPQITANDRFLQACEGRGALAGMVSDELAWPYQVPPGYPRGKYLLAFDPLHGETGLDEGASAGSLFSVLRAPEPGRDAADTDFFQAGERQVAAGYVLYGAATLLVLSVGAGVRGFTLHPELGDFVLTHPDIVIAPDATELAVNPSNAELWETPVKRYVDECLEGAAGARGREFAVRGVGSCVMEAHRLLLRGGVLLWPTDTLSASVDQRLRLLYQLSPLAYLVEQAGGRATTGRERALSVVPTALHQTLGAMLGAKNEIERIERYHAEPHVPLSHAPLFNERGLFRD